MTYKIHNFIPQSLKIIKKCLIIAIWRENLTFRIWHFFSWKFFSYFVKSKQTFRFDGKKNSFRIQTFLVKILWLLRKKTDYCARKFIYLSSLRSQCLKMRLFKLFLYTMLFIDTDDNIVFFWLTGSTKTILAFFIKYFFKTILFTVVYHDNLWRLS